MSADLQVVNPVVTVSRLLLPPSNLQSPNSFARVITWNPSAVTSEGQLIFDFEPNAGVVVRGSLTATATLRNLVPGALVAVSVHRNDVNIAFAQAPLLADRRRQTALGHSGGENISCSCSCTNALVRAASQTNASSTLWFETAKDRLLCDRHLAVVSNPGTCLVEDVPPQRSLMQCAELCADLAATENCSPHVAELCLQARQVCQETHVLAAASRKERSRQEILVARAASRAQKARVALSIAEKEVDRLEREASERRKAVRLLAARDSGGEIGGGV